ncbi:sigma-54 interaction domain-containing protein [Tepidanaerobacter syntrophicus]|uniref:HTH-type transcriptional regulatory protein TyrR n=1 Tax=Tepidanaerobacter syntrophicus TaxID=224999 RepID=A0A0U9HQ38_9FIRM|nr:sigma 54-interacting transcriptional regulator [Tepidanaerobacter syntrophicus]GAQ25175.1 PAS domain S-box-containing protein [Tepidanaerobacter syntrophicus]GLI18664.1 hypothetical protein TSYNTROPHJE_04770 [Tepidanaerobacter syntrophicus]HHV82343.1 sigma 54-interacting transcriptional regulator [Tepidanaerobacter syntrophicus]
MCQNGKSFVEITNEKVFDSLPLGIIITDQEGTIALCNKVAEELIGFKKELIEGSPLQDVIPDVTLGNGSFTRIRVRENKSFDESKIISAEVNPISDESEILGYSVVFNRHFLQTEAMPRLRSKDLDRDSDFEIADGAFKNIIGSSKRLLSALKVAAKAAKTSSTVLLQGESGTGKELVAEAIHCASKRCDGPFIKVNCPGIPADLMESELFGHEKGAFTGAIYQKIGKFELANGGTIFLDEIGELDKNLQSKLLRVLQEREFERVGGNRVLKTDVRIIAATHRNLQEMVSFGDFREDLYYRLNVVPIVLPSLRERKEDIPLLVEHFLRKLCIKLGVKSKSITKRAVESLYNYDWPGNVRELENIIERAINLAETDVIDISDLPQGITNRTSETKRPLINLEPDGELASYDDYEKAIIKVALNKYKSFNAAGKALGITHKTVAAKARRYGIIE